MFSSLNLRGRSRSIRVRGEERKNPNEQYFIAAVGWERRFFMENVEKYFGEGAELRPGVEIDTGDEGFILEVELDEDLKKGLAQRMRQDCKRQYEQQRLQQRHKYSASHQEFYQPKSTQIHDRDYLTPLPLPTNHYNHPHEQTHHRLTRPVSMPANPNPTSSTAPHSTYRYPAEHYHAYDKSSYDFNNLPWGPSPVFYEVSRNVGPYENNNASSSPPEFEVNVYSPSSSLKGISATIFQIDGNNVNGRHTLRQTRSAEEFAAVAEWFRLNLEKNPHQ